MIYVPTLDGKRGSGEGSNVQKTHVGAFEYLEVAYG